MDEITVKCAASGYPAWQQWYILSNVNKTNGPNVGILFNVAYCEQEQLQKCQI